MRNGWWDRRPSAFAWAGRHATPDHWAFLAGLVATAALPPLPGTGWLMPCALAVLLGALLSSKHPARTAWTFGLVHQATLLHWLFLLEPPATVPTIWLVPIQAILAIFYVSLFYLLFGWTWRLLRSWLGAGTALALSPVLWVGMEVGRGIGEMGFPWCLSGAAWLQTPLLPLAATSGEIGLAAATVLTATALVAVVPWGGPGGPQASLRPLARGSLVGMAVLWWAFLIGGSTWHDPGAKPFPAQAFHACPAAVDSLAAARRYPRRDSLRVAACQANVSLRYKWEEGRLDSTRVPYTNLTRAAARQNAELVVWAETAVPAYLMYDRELLTWIRGLVTREQIFLYAGFPDARLSADGHTIRYNSSGLIAPDGSICDFYAKHHLLPIGEAMPFHKVLPFLGRLDVGQAEWSVGERPHPLALTTSRGDVRMAGLICFESIFSDLSLQAVREGAEILVNITNDGWFGKTAGPRQHAALARLRAAECGVPLVRCANNGISLITDASGRIVRAAGLDRRAVVIADVAPGRRDTLYVKAGARPLAVVLGVWTVLAILVTRPARRS